MTGLLEFRDTIINIYRRYEGIINLVVKFLLVLLAMTYINGKIGYEDKLTSVLPVLIISLICTLLPGTAIVALLALVIVVHLYALAMEAALVGAILFLIMFLLYFRFTPKDSMLLVVAPTTYMLGFPQILPIAGGLLYNPASAVTVVLAQIINSFITFVAENETTIGASSEEEDMIAKFRFIIDGIMKNHSMMILAAAAAITVLIVYLIRRLPVKYSSHIAIVTGAIMQLILVLIGDMMYSTNTAIGSAFLGVIVATAIAEVIAFFLFNLDYSRIENVQFEDDDYYYYVKAVPKVALQELNHQVKTINASRYMDEEDEEGIRYDEMDPEER